MDLTVLKSFSQELEKLSVSAATTLSLLQQRVAQGARVAPAVMQRAEAAAAQGLTQTPAAARRAALGAGESVRLQQAAQEAAQNPVTQASKARLEAGYERAVSGAPGVFDTSKVLPAHYDYGATAMAGSSHPYSRAHIDSLMGRMEMVNPGGVGAIPVIDPHARTAVSLQKVNPPVDATRRFPRAA
jgi:hypothetical protein